jgi:hypothetical protein
VRRVGFEKLLGSNLWINYDRASYKSVVPRSKDGGCTSTFRGDVGGLVRRVFIDGLVSRIWEVF